MGKTADQIITDALAVISGYQPSASTAEGSVVRDIGVEAFAAELANTYSSLDDLKYLLTLDANNIASDSDLNKIAVNYGLTRQPATAATGQVTFGSLIQPVSSIRIGAIDGTGGVSIATPLDSDSTQISFLTTATVYLTPSSPYNPDTGLYEVSAPVISLITGQIGNVGVNTITIITNAISGVNSVTNNVALTNGTDIETNTDLIDRIKVKLAGNILGNIAGFNSLILAQANVTDVNVIDPNSTASLRGPGGIDIYVIGSVVGVATDTVMRAAETEVILENQPASDISAITGTSGTAPYTFIEGVDFIFVQDITSVYAGSTRALNKIVWNNITLPDIGTNYSISYTYNTLINTLQVLVENPTNHIICNDVLIKLGMESLVDIAFDIAVLPGFDAATTRTNVINALTTYVNNLGLGESLRQSGVINAVEDVSGVDYISVPLTKLARRGYTGVADLSAGAGEYFRVDANSFTIGYL